MEKEVRMLPQEAGKPTQRRSPQETEELAMAGAQQASPRLCAALPQPRTMRTYHVLFLIQEELQK